jgi:hypothetical protein
MKGFWKNKSLQPLQSLPAPLRKSERREGYPVVETIGGSQALAEFERIAEGWRHGGWAVPVRSAHGIDPLIPFRQ